MAKRRTCILKRGGNFSLSMCFCFFYWGYDKFLFQRGIVDPAFMANILSFLRIKIQWVSIKELQFLNKHLRLLWQTVILVDYRLFYNNNLYFMVYQMAFTDLHHLILTTLVFAHCFLKHFTFLKEWKLQRRHLSFFSSSPKAI